VATPFYPYPTLEKDGYELAVVEQGDSRRVIAAPLVSDEERFAAKPGDIVKLIFEYREAEGTMNGEAVGAEHMWVEITDYGDGCLIGQLDNSPQFTTLLKSDDVLSFHPKHIIAFSMDK